MEQELNQFKENEFNYFKIEHKNQNVKKIAEFQKWYESANKYVKNENLKRGLWDDHHIVDNSLLTISFCNKCQNYAICDFTNEYSCIRCTHCNHFFCAGCSWEENSHREEDTLCLKGYIKLLYLRIKYRRTCITKFKVIICYNPCFIFPFIYSFIFRIFILFGWIMRSF